MSTAAQRAVWRHRKRKQRQPEEETEWERSGHSAASIRRSKERARERAAEQERADRRRTCHCKRPLRGRRYLGWWLCSLCQRLIHPEDLPGRS